MSLESHYYFDLTIKQTLKETLTRKLWVNVGYWKILVVVFTDQVKWRGGGKNGKEVRDSKME